MFVIVGSVILRFHCSVQVDQKWVYLLILAGSLDWPPPIFCLIETVLHSIAGGSGTILLDDLDCTGDEFTLLHCSHRPVGQHDCSHGDDVGVRCTGLFACLLS